MDPGAVGAVAGLGLLVAIGIGVCIYDRCTDSPRTPLLPGAAPYRPSHWQLRRLFQE